MANKQSKWFVVATEGATTDGRTINRSWIEQMAKNYNPKKYGARVNLEHIKFSMYLEDFPHSKCFGDVIALKAEENTEGKLQLFAQIDPTEDLIKLNENRQKVYTSIEVDPNFADTGEAYLVGLAVTDNPASLGTDMLSFSAGHNILSARKEKADNIFTAAIETSFEFEEVEEKQLFSVFEKIKNLFASKEKNADLQFADHQKAIELLGEQSVKTTEEITALSTQTAELSTDFSEMEKTVQALEQKFAQLAKQPEQNYTARPLIAGDNKSEHLTDC
ncbi:MAG: GPO family capsid scaffolding protein [[Pasteurella] mairii]|nr:GPO family capsid scaffolding protein [[Pasteurella] mairii]